MKLSRIAAALTVLAAPLALAADPAPAKLCQDSLTQDRQGDFGAATLDLNTSTLEVTKEAPPRLKLNTNLTALDPEHIFFPFDQRVTISYVYESASASHALGYMYLDDVKARGYINAAGELVDSNTNGIFDLHEDLYNLSPPSGPKSRPYTGLSRRCSQTFTSGNLTYSQPDLGLKSGCANTFVSQTNVADARPGRTSTLIKADVVGTFLRATDSSTTNAGASDFSDNGLFGHIPNLLEPPADLNGNKGLGKMVFLLADDDGAKDTYGKLAPVTDLDEIDDGIPDYDVSAYDSRGLLRAANPDKGISAYDRTVDLGNIKGGKEIVFFLVVFYDTRHGPNEGSSYACLKQDTEGKCLLHLRTPINVFFSKAAWNLDQNFLNGPVAERNIGCGYDSRCNPEAPSDHACTVEGTSTKLCGWLDGPKSDVGTTLHRLANDVAYGKLDMPMEKVTVPRPAGVRNPMPHVIVGAPTTDPFRWILGFEDISGGGDRDFNDVVFVINKQNGGGTRSATVSGDISPDIADDFVITKVRFKRQDDTAPAPRTCAKGAPCWTEEVPGACTPANGVLPFIRYSLAVDCRICTGGTCTDNPTPTWFPVEFPDTSPPKQEVELDLLSMGFTGSQLCWKVDVSSPNERCRPVIDNIDVGYQAVRSGSYARASPSTLGNAIVWGVNETPGSGWGKGWPASGLPAPGKRAYDARKDYALRGRVYFRSLYDPELPNTTNIVDRWDAGRVMALSLAGDLDPLTRKLYTVDTLGNRTTVTAEMEDGDSTSPLFPDSLCDAFEDDRYLYDLNNDGKCGTPSSASPDKRVTGVTNDRNFLREWLYGWEDHYSPGDANVKRPWPLGGINLSTVAMVVPPYLDSWAQNTRPDERDEYRKNFMEPLAERPTVGLVGTMNGFLHAFDAGGFRHGTTDECAAGAQLRGFFEPSGACTKPVAPRQYGSGQEVFAYLPRLLLERYRNLYVQFPGSGDLPRPQVDASPTVANVDFGISGKPAWTRATSASRTTGAKTVMVSASGRNSPAVFALDITDPSNAWYPLPLWEFNLRNPAIDLAFLAAKNAGAAVTYPDNSGSRHAPSVARLTWGSGSTAVWTAVVGTDYVPAEPTRAGTVYLVDMKTGLPLNFGASAEGAMAGIITLDAGSGVAAESALVDLNQDGSYDVIYVPTTAGSVYRINLNQVDTAAPPGRKVKTCRVASAPVALSEHPDAAPGQDNSFQQLYSNLGVKVVRDSGPPTVRFYFGTGDNPDESTDGPADKSAYRYHLLGFEDPDPAGAGSCELLDPLWVQALDPGQTVWGGVALSKETVYATTAVGRAADICNLSDTENGRLYETSQLPKDRVLKKATLGGHGINAPVVHDQHLFVLTATGDMQMVGGDNWNNGTANSGAARSRILLYDPIPDGRLPR
jgi:type IV pilus assembly protein PilY1